MNLILKDKIKNLIFVVAPLLLGFVFAVSLFRGILFFYNNFEVSGYRIDAISSWLGGIIFATNKDQDDNKISIHLNVKEKEIFIKKGEALIDTFKVLSVASPDTVWEPINGKYVVSGRFQKYKSKIAKEYWPNAVVVGPNIIFHGPKDGSGAVSVELNQKDSEKLLNMVSVGDEVLVSGGREGSEVLPMQKIISGFEKPIFANPDSGKMPAVGAEAFLVTDVNSGEIIFSKNAEKVFPIASVSKLFTTWFAMEKAKDLTVPISFPRGVVETYGQQGRFNIGDEFSLSDVIYALLLESSNDAAEAIANNFERSLFLSEMNEKIKSIGLADTSLNDPSGLSPKNVSTANDLNNFLSFVYKNKPEIFEVSNNRDYQSSGGSRSIRWLSNNKFISQMDQRIIGGKNGYTEEAGQTFAGVFSFPFSESESKDISVVILKSFNRNRDIENILHAVEQNILYPIGLTQSDISKKRYVSKNVQTTQDEKIVSLIAVGDIMLGRGIKNVVYGYGKGDYSFMFEKSFFLDDADITFGNLEGPISDLGYDLGSIYSFRMEPKVIDALKEVGFDVLSVANNHMGDWSMTAFEDTMDRLYGAGIKYVGGGKNKKDATSVKIIEKDGISIGFLAFSDVGPEWLAKNSDLSFMLSAKDQDIVEIIATAASLVDHLVVSYHFGEEYSKEPTDRQKYLAKMSIDYGARVVLGHHPHVVLPTEFYRDGFIAYSMGNFIFDQNFSKETSEGQVLNIVFDKQGIVSARGAFVDFNKLFQPSLRVDI